MDYDAIMKKWNTDADKYNQWCALAEDEKIEFAFKLGQSLPNEEAHMGQFNLIIQRPKPKKPVNGVLNITRDGEATFFEGDGEHGSNIVAELLRVRIEFANSHGIMLSGVELMSRGYRYQEWWLVYKEEK